MKYCGAIGIATILVTGGAVLGAWPTAGSADVVCPPNLAAITVDDNVMVVARCEMRGTTVEGNVRLFAGGSLLARNAIIDGNLQARTAFDIDVAESAIDGNVQLDDLVGDRAFFAGTTVDGNFRIRDNRVLVELLDNDLRSNVEASRNRGGVHLFGNAVGGKLECRRNDPAPVGGGNRVRGRTEGQCAALNEARPPPAEPPPAPPPGGESPPPADPAGSAVPPPTGEAPPPSAGDASPNGPFNPVTDGASGGGGSVDPLALVLAGLGALWGALRRAP